MITDKTIELTLKLVEALIWPLTILIILIIFRNQFKGVLGRIGSINASSTGFSMTFDKKIEQAKKLLRGINPSKILSKESTEAFIDAKESKETSFSNLLDIQANLNTFLIDIAKSSNITFQNKSSSTLSSELKEVGIITFQKFKLIESLLDIINSADSTFKVDHLKVAQELYKAIDA